MSHKNENNSLTRKILQLNSVDGYDLVQDFYPTDEKRTDPFLLKAKYNPLPDFNYFHLPTKGNITIYYKNNVIEHEISADKTNETFYFITGKKAKQLAYNASAPDDYDYHEILYYVTGEKCKEERSNQKSYITKQWHKNGQLLSLDDGSSFIFWNETGQKIEENTVDDFIFDGPYLSWYDNGQLRTQGNFISDSREGLWCYWHSNGQKQLEGTIKNNQPEDKWRGWHENGSKGFIQQYKQGKPDGIFYKWHCNGQLKQQEHFCNGSKQGLSISFHPLDPTLFYQIDYTQNNGTGHWVEWFDNGQKYIEGDYKQGIKNGLWRVWYPNGQLKTQGQLEQNTKVGLWQYWFEDGQLQKEVNYHNHQPETVPDSNGLRDAEYWPWITPEYTLDCFTNEVHYSFSKEYYDNGQLSVYASYIDDCKTTGSITYYYKSGHKMAEQYFYNNQRTGLWLLWSEQGEILAEAYFQNGLLEYGYLPDIF